MLLLKTITVKRSQGKTNRAVAVSVSPSRRSKPDVRVKKSAMEFPVQDLPTIERAQKESGFSSSESVLNILELILAGSELSEVLTIIAQLVESQGSGMFCAIWLPGRRPKKEGEPPSSNRANCLQ